MNDEYRELYRLELKEAVQLASRIGNLVEENFGHSSTTAMAVCILFIVMSKSAGVPDGHMMELFETLSHVVEILGDGENSDLQRN
jgi:hypothetical protein